MGLLDLLKPAAGTQPLPQSGTATKKSFFLTVVAAFALMIVWIFGSYFLFWGKTPRVDAAVDPTLTTGRQQKITAPVEETPKLTPLQEDKKTEQKQTQGRRESRRTERPPQKTEAQKLAEETRNKAGYSKPLVEGIGGQHGTSTQQASIQNGNHRNVMEIPATGGNGSYSRNQVAGNVWNREFYAQGQQGQAGVLQPVGSPFQVLPGNLIFARLLTPMNTDSPGQVTAEVIQPVYDSATGQHVLIPPGSILVGVGDSRVKYYGQDRIPSAWHLLRLPNGRKMPLGAMPGADLAGTGGIPGEVNNHYWSTAGWSLVRTLTGAASSFATQGNYDGDYGADDALRTEAGREIGREGRYATQRRTRPPTITTGRDRFSVQVVSALTFDGPYQESAINYAMEGD